MADIDFIVEFPVANPVKFTLDSGITTNRANFDQQRIAGTTHASVKREGTFVLPFENTDTIKVKHYTNYPLCRLSVIDCDENKYNLSTGAIDGAAYYTPSLDVAYRNKTYRSSCRFASIEDKLFIYFEDEVLYTDEDFLVAGDLVSLNGVLPDINAEVGDLLTYKIGSGSFTSTPITEKRWNVDLGVEGYLTDVDYTLTTPVTGLVQVDYDEKDADLYERVVDISNLAPGKYFIRMEFGVSSYTKSFTTEPIDVQEEHEDTLVIEYRHDGTFNDNDLWGYIYDTGETNLIRLPIDFYKVIPAGEIERDMNDTGRQRLLRAVPYRQIAFEAYDIPGWLVDKLQIIFSHDSKKINEYYWENENYGQFEIVAKTDRGNYTINLNQVDDRTKKSNLFTESLTASFTPSSSEGIDYAGDVIVVQFNTNSGGTFYFQSLPAWITADVEEFEDGDFIELTIAANATAFDRTIQLIAVSDAFDGLTATLDIEQLYDTSIVEYIDVSTNPVSLVGGAGANQLLNVSSSGDYTISYSGVHTFTAVKESGFTQVRISEPTQNSTDEDRVGVVRLTLNSNPSIFIDIDITQEPFYGMISVSPGLIVVGPDGDDITTDVYALLGVDWQASCPNQGTPHGLDKWVNFDTNIFTGEEPAFAIMVEGKPPYISPRETQVTFFNILNPSDSVVLTIQQTD